MLHKNLLSPENTVLLVVDVQEAFRDAIGNFATIAANIARAVSAFEMLSLPVLVTEQYPKGLGPTAEEIRYSMADRFEPIEKTSFSAFGSEDLLIKLEDLVAKQVVLCGIETHICVNQTAHDLLHNDYSVHLLTDCVGSRYEHDRAAGLEKMQASGAVFSSVEMAVFEIMRDATHPRFKDIQALIK